jgi:uncharacterized protein (TIGR02453 family)
MFNGFSPSAFTFLRGLKRNNNKAWFEAHRETYENELRAPMRALLDDLDAVLGETAPEFRADPRKSMFRIHRDIRFSADKSPYKTHAACWLFHQDAGHGVGQEAHGGAGFYLHVEPGACMVGGGLWMPPKPALDRIRNRLVADHAGFASIIEDRAMRRRFRGLSDEAMLARTPRGYDAAHPAAQWLRYKSYTIGRQLGDRDVTSRALVRTFTTDVKTMLPFVRWLNDALGLPRAAARWFQTSR